MKPSIRLVIPILAAFLSGAAASASCPPLSLNQLNPASGTAGDPVELSGTGFCGPIGSFFAWGFDGVHGFAFELASATPGALQSTVGPVVEGVNGPTVLWRGRQIALPDAALQLADGLYHLHSSRVLLVGETALGPQFSAVAGPGEGFTSTLVGGALVIDFAPTPPLSALSSAPLARHLSHLDGEPLPDDSENAISVLVVVKTNGSPNDGNGDPPDEDPNTSAPGRWVLEFELDCFGTPPACSGSLADVVGAALTNRTGGLGMGVSVAGSSLTLSHGTNQISGGFITVTP